MKKNTSRPSPKAKIVIVMTAVLAIGYIVGCQMSFRAGNPDITEAGTCKGLAPDGTPAEPTDTFPADTERVYVYFRLVGGIPTRVTFRWYYEDQFVGEASNYYQPGLNYTYFSQKTQKYVPGGSYKVEILMGDEILRTLRFRVQGEKVS